MNAGDKYKPPMTPEQRLEAEKRALWQQWMMCLNESMRVMRELGEAVDRLRERLDEEEGEWWKQGGDDGR